ncbi:DUF1652 domain-containing protein [Pseudomonas sp. SZMC_28357]|uniref:DUF1652 domain-containing protein n=1 Tax=Pseudomonas sp. SZMC_28357 TaxID=3074380 RepID=UPI0028719BC8|nr:DUF1652 domain-containing protein [Pseudomonas sp. SZMC_28357]MDR9752705.1 DUF1652 domain-containing protein [Pseudomonas sp. SZMC_28357]
MALPIQHLCQTLESGFLPLSCSCTVNGCGSLTITVTDPLSGHIELLLNGVSPVGFDSVRDIANFIGELRTEISAGRRAFAGA